MKNPFSRLAPLCAANVSRHIACLALAGLMLLSIRTAQAQALSVSAGGMSAIGQEGKSYSWDIDYRQYINRHLAWSAMWLNEGHIAGHHRDGLAAEIWGSLPLLNDRLELAIGAGLYRSFDTQPTTDSNGNADATNDVHQVASIYSASATWRTRSRWFIRATANRISYYGNNVDSFTYLIGAGYWIGSVKEDGTGAPMPVKAEADDAGNIHRNELTLFIGESIVNTLGSEKGFAQGLEYRRRVSPHIDWTVSAINEGDSQIMHRYGAATQIWIAGRFFDERLQVGIGGGIYYTFNSAQTGNSEDWSSFCGLISPTVSYRFADHWLARLTWNRVVSTYGRDADVFLLGAGYAWGGAK